MNADNIVDVSDLTALSLHLLGDAVLKGDSLKNAAVNGDGKVDIADLAHLKMFILDSSVKLGSQE